MQTRQRLHTTLCVLGICLLCFLSTENGVGVAFAEEVDAQLEEEIDNQVESEVQDEVDGAVEEFVEDEMEGHVEDEVEGQVEDEVEHHVQAEVEDQVENEVEDDVESEIENQTAVDELDGHSESVNVTDDVIDEQQINKVLEVVETTGGAQRIDGELILLTDEFHPEEFAKQGLEITKVTKLKGLNQFLVEVKESTYKEQQLDDSDLEFNHLYTLQDDPFALVTPKPIAAMPQQQLELADNLNQFSKSLAEHPVKIGVIDSGVDITHSAFKNANIHAENFVTAGNPVPETHGTAITSILVGNTEQMHGLIPSAQIYSANVFFSSHDTKQYASVKSLLLALNWMVEEKVEVINMSLSGPANPILEKALAQVRSRGVLLLAAAGNNGPTGAPAYPAAYQSVIAVTAVNHKNFAYFNANRGAYIDVAALGVDVFHAIPANQYETSSGTSYAVPFVTAISAALLRNYNAENVEEIIFKNALDLGEKGKDFVYGYGLAQINSSLLSDSISLLEKQK